MEKKLNQFLADISVLSKKVQNYHWNIEGKSFFTVHAKLDEVYEGLNENIDEVAERMLALGYRPLSNFKSYLEVTKIKEGDNEAVSIETALSTIIEDYKILLTTAKEIKVLADENVDYGTSAMVDEFIIESEKLLWMINAYLK